MNIAIIPARGGSKRIPRKNIRVFSGRPMIAHAIMAALECGLFDKVVVSTDDQEIADVAKEWGAAVPFERPAELADDHTPTVPVIAHSIETLMGQGVVSRYACCIYPCTPFTRPDDLINAFELMKATESTFVYPVTEYPHPIQRAMRRNEHGSMQFLHPENELKRTQDFEQTFHDAGQFYWGQAVAWLAQKKMHTDGVGMVVPPWRYVDIDTENDWKRAELMYESLMKLMR